MNRRDFFRRTAPLAGVALLAAPLAGMLKKDEEVIRTDTGGLIIKSDKGVSIHNCHFEMRDMPCAIKVENGA